MKRSQAKDQPFGPSLVKPWSPPFSHFQNNRSQPPTGHNLLWKQWSLLGKSQTRCEPQLCQLGAVRPWTNLLIYVLSHFSHVWLSKTPWTVARQASLSIGSSRQEYQSGLPCPPPGALPNPGIEPASPALAGGFFTTSIIWGAQIKCSRD